MRAQLGKFTLVKNLAFCVEAKNYGYLFSLGQKFFGEGIKRGYANAAADKLVSDAQVSQHDRINRANDQVAEFYGLFQEYQQNRDVVYERVFREKVVTIFNQMGGKIVLPEGTNTPQIFLP